MSEADNSLTAEQVHTQTKANETGKLQTQSNLKILLAAENSTQALARLLELKQESKPSFSLAAFAKRLGLKSKGYVSEVLSGKKLIHEKHIEAIAAIFDLSSEEKRCFDCLLNLDHSENEAAAQQARSRLREIRKQLMIGGHSRLPIVKEQFLAFDVFAALGLFENHATFKQLDELFFEQPVGALQEALGWLEKWHLVVRENQVYKTSESGFVLLSEGIESSAKDFWIESLNEARKAMDRWSQDKERSYFYSVVISASELEYIKKLRELRETVSAFATSAESSSGDMLFRMNVQVYPRILRRKKK